MVRFGKVASSWCERFDIKPSVFVADFAFEPLIRKASNVHVIYEELNRFPPVERDLAIVIDDTTSYEDIHSVVIKTGGEWLTRLGVFDIYVNAEHLGLGKMSMALRFTIENKDATLTDRDIEQWLSRMQKALMSEVGAEIRK